jgi:hypothetical protein
MKIRYCLLFYPLALILPLTASFSVAQQTEGETPGAVPKEQNPVPVPVPEAGNTADNSKNTGSANIQNSTRFTPTEKIHADDAVSFPVDI